MKSSCRTQVGRTTWGPRNDTLFHPMPTLPAYIPYGALRVGSHVGFMLSDPYGTDITHLLLSHAHFTNSYPLWDPYGQRTLASSFGSFYSHTFITLAVCFWSLSCWKTHPQSILRRLSPRILLVQGPIHLSTSMLDSRDGVLGVIVWIPKSLILVSSDRITFSQSWYLP